MKYTKHMLLKLLIKEYEVTKDNSISNKNILDMYTDNNSAYKAYEKLKAKGYIDFAIDPMTGEIIGLDITDKAVTYSEDNFRRNIKDAIPIISLILSVISIVFDILQWIYG